MARSRRTSQYLRGGDLANLADRRAVVERQTRQWLTEYVDAGAASPIPYQLLMRPDGDFTPDDEFKRGWLRDGLIPRERVLCVYDDRDKVVAMWRAEGLACFQVAQGDF